MAAVFNIHKVSFMIIMLYVLHHNYDHVMSNAHPFKESINSKFKGFVGKESNVHNNS